MDIISTIKKSSKTFVIAEIGQNHQGDITIAQELIRKAKDSGADCVKFQKTCIEEKFTKSALTTPYISRNSWGNTYGEHKAHLEFSNDEFVRLQEYAKGIGMLFTASAMDEKSLQFLESIQVPFIKIGSGDSNNYLLIEKAAKIGTPLVISTGMISFETVQEIYDLVSKYHNKFALLQCTSAYPTPYKDINLKVLNHYQQKFSDIVIGYSGHEIGIHITIAAVAMGAKIIERHITLDKSQKGTDHKCSLEPSEFKELVYQIRTLEAALGKPIKSIQESERPCYEKLGKSLVYATSFGAGHKMGLADFKVKVSVPKGIDAANYKQILGKVLCCTVDMDDPVKEEDFCEPPEIV